MNLRFLGVGFFILLSACAQQPSAKPAATVTQGPPIKAIATVMELHQTMVTPASDAIFNAGLEPPKDDQAWTDIRNNALILAESGNLLMTGDRAKDTGPWMEMSQAMVDAAVAAKNAAEAKDTNALTSAGDQIVAACMRCHEPYRDHGRKMGQ